MAIAQSRSRIDNARATFSKQIFNGYGKGLMRGLEFVNGEGNRGRTAGSRRGIETEGKRMANRLISVQAIRRRRARCCPYYSEYLKWSNYEVVKTEFWSASTANYRLKRKINRSEFDRQVYDRDLVAEHAFMTNTLLTQLKLRKWLIQLTDSHPWFGKAVSHKQNSERISYMGGLASASPFKASAFGGGILYEQVPYSFVNLFLDYPFLNSRCDIELLSVEKPLIVTLSNHLRVDWITTDEALFKDIVRFNDALPLNRVIDSPAIYVHPSISQSDYCSVS